MLTHEQQRLAAATGDRLARRANRRDLIRMGITIAFCVWCMLVAGALSSCTREAGQKIPDNIASQIVPGVTTEANMRSLLGPPMAKRVASDGRYVLVWQHIRASTFSGGESQGLGVLFTADGKVERITTEIRSSRG